MTATLLSPRRRWRWAMMCTSPASWWGCVAADRILTRWWHTCYQGTLCGRQHCQSCRERAPSRPEEPLEMPIRDGRPEWAKGVPRPALRRKKRLLPCPAPQNTIAAQPRPARGSGQNCGAFAGQNENSKTLKRPKIFTNAYGRPPPFLRSA